MNEAIKKYWSGDYHGAANLFAEFEKDSVNKCY